ncbi:MAG TPA: ABC-2 transporter permease [Acidobacteriaceae bacterium]|nr:ABC-2 transporter permease [Acidobacteriaceae bacterium]
MKRTRTNYAMVRRLILKDWYLNRWMIFGSIPAGLASLAIVLTGKQVAFMLCIILLCMVIVGVGAQLAMVTTVNERKEQTLAFIMSLPVSWREYTAAKLLANLIIFIIPWLALTAGAIGVLCLPGATHGLIPFTAIMAVEMLITTCLIVVAGVITESQAWATVGIFCSSLGINGLGYAFAHLRGISAYMWGMQVRWTPTAWTVLIAELLMVPLLLGTAFFVQSRKTDFL